MSKTSGSTPQPPSTIPIPRSKRGIRGFFGDVVREMKRVHWPPYQETNRLTGVVLALCTLLVAMLSGMHYVIRFAISAIIGGG